MKSILRLCFVLAPVMLTVIPVAAQQQPLVVGTQAQSQSHPQAASQSSSATGSTMNDGGWHFGLSPYLWFAGTHGTTGAFGRDASVHASPGDLLSHFNFGLMGSAEASYKRFLLDGDLLWIRLSDSSALPFPGLAATSVDVRVGQLVWTSKVGYRIIDNKRLKADANVGARYWHLGEKLNFYPSILGLNFTPSQAWADIVIGGRIEVPLGPKLSITALGDVGGWNATAKLDYQFAGLLAYKLRSKLTLLAGYRYLYVDYRSSSFVYNMTTPGALIGITYRFK